MNKKRTCFYLLLITFLTFGSVCEITDAQVSVKMQFSRTVPEIFKKNYYNPNAYSIDFKYSPVNANSVRTSDVQTAVVDIGQQDQIRNGAIELGTLGLHTDISGDQQHGQGHGQQNFHEHFV